MTESTRIIMNIVLNTGPNIESIPIMKAYVAINNIRNKGHVKITKSKNSKKAIIYKYYILFNSYCT